MSIPSGIAASGAPEAVELAAECGRALDEWQELVLDALLAIDSAGLPSTADLVLIASRQNGKNGAIEVAELDWCVQQGLTVIHTAHLFKTARESYDKLLSLVEAHPDIRGELAHKVASPAAGYEMRFRSGGRAIFIARSRSSGRGLTGDRLVIDEAQDLDDDALGALLPVVSARPNRQVLYTGSAPGMTSFVLHRLRKRGRGLGATNTERFAFFEFSADPDCDLDDRGQWAQANPSFGDRISVESIESERASMSDEMFARERLSISPDLPDEDANGIPREAWRECAKPESKPAGKVAFAVDMPWSRAKAVIVAAGQSTVDGKTHLEVIEQRSGVKWIVERLVELRDKWGPVAVTLDPSGPAGALVAELEQAGVELTLPTGRQYAQACGAFFDDIVEPRLAHLDDKILNSAVAGTVKKNREDLFVWDRRRPEHDVSPVIAATLARWAWVTQEAPEPGKPLFFY